MKRASLLLLGSLVSCAAVDTTQDAVAPPSERITNLRFLAGMRELDEDDWDPVDSHVALGVEADTFRPVDPIGFEAGFAYSEDDDNVSGAGGSLDVELRGWEIYGGLRKTWLPADRRLRPYVGGGVTYLTGELELDGTISGFGFVSGEDEDSSLGGYIHGGAGYQVTDHFSIGLDLRGVFATEFEGDLDGDYFQATGFIALTL